MIKKPPKVVYKYRPWSLEGNEDWYRFTREIFQKREIYFARPSEFNDPFDVFGDYDYSMLSVNEWNLWIDFQLSGLIKNGFSEDEIDGHRRRLTNPNYPYWENKFEVEQLSYRIVDGFRSNVGIFSTSARSIHPLLWAHYADKHTGICIGFDSQLIGDSTTAYGRVLYSLGFKKEAIKPDIDRDSKGIIKLLTSKSHFWSYEKEVRYFDLFRNGKSRIKEFDPAAIVEIIFGCEMDFQMKRRTYQFVKELGCFDHVKFYSAHKIPKYYLLRIRPLDKKYWY